VYAKVLPPGAVAEVDMSFDVGGRSKEVRFELRTDKGSYMVSVDPPAGELLRAHCMTRSAFAAAAAQLAGMNEGTLSFSAAQRSSSDSGSSAWWSAAQCAVVRAANVAPVTDDANTSSNSSSSSSSSSSGSSSSGALLACFAGLSLGGGLKERVLIQLRGEAGGTGRVTLSVHSDNAMLPPLLLPALRKSIESGGR
jgi:hypothetical protein